MDQSRLAFTLDGIGHQLADRLLAVPVYQRSYSWEPQQIAEFWGDLRLSFSQANGEYFLGTIVLSKEGITGRDAIIDGQQRLATTAILLAAVRNIYRSRGDEKRAQIIQQNYLSKADLSSGDEVPRLALNSEDDAFFRRRIILSEPASSVPSLNLSHTLLESALKTLEDLVGKVADDAGPEWERGLVEWTEFLSKRVRVIVVEVPTESDAFMIFETLNDRGADLTIADLLKNYLLGRAGRQLETVRSAWLLALGALDITAENKTFITFLRHFWSSKHGAVRERDLYRSIKQRVTTETNVVEFSQELQQSARLYAAIFNSDNDFWSPLGTEAKRNVEKLLDLELEQYRPLLLAAMQHFTPEELKRLLRAMLCWSVRGLIVGGIGGGTAEAAYCDAASQIRSGSAKTADDVLPIVKHIVPSDQEFETALASARVPRGSLARYYLLAFERALLNDPEPELVPNDDEAKVNLEHILPRNPTDAEWGQFTSDQRRDYVTRLGNMTLLAKGPNGRIGNKPFSVKQPILAASKFELTKRAGAEQDWTTAVIETRQKVLAALGPVVWPRVPK